MGAQPSGRLVRRRFQVGQVEVAVGYVGGEPAAGRRADGVADLKVAGGPVEDRLVRMASTEVNTWKMRGGAVLTWFSQNMKPPMSPSRRKYPEYCE